MAHWSTGTFFLSAFLFLGVGKACWGMSRVFVILGLVPGSSGPCSSSRQLASAVSVGRSVWACCGAPTWAGAYTVWDGGLEVCFLSHEEHGHIPGGRSRNIASVVVASVGGDRMKDQLLTWARFHEGHWAPRGSAEPGQQMPGKTLHKPGAGEGPEKPAWAGASWIAGVGLSHKA